MTVRHLEFLVEEPSMEVFLQAVLPRLLPARITFEIHVFQGKHDLLRKLNDRLRGYKHWLSGDCRLVVMVDRDDEDCLTLKRKLEDAAAQSGLRTRSQAGGGSWQVVNRVVVEELEAWYFGDWEAVRSAYPNVPPDIPHQSNYRDPDAITIAGGTWEAFERILKRHGYFKTGLRKREAARAVAAHIDPVRNRSRSFVTFRDAIAATAASGTQCADTS